MKIIIRVTTAFFALLSTAGFIAMLSTIGLLSVLGAAAAADDDLISPIVCVQGPEPAETRRAGPPAMLDTY